MLKAVGLILLFCTFAVLGQQKAAAVIKRKNTLSELCKCFNEMIARLRYEGSERMRLIEESFSKSGIVELKDSGIRITQCGLTAEDKTVLSEFFEYFGSGDITSEQERIELYKSIFEQKKHSAETDAAQKAKLYRTIGFCAGAAVCILLI